MIKTFLLLSLFPFLVGHAAGQCYVTCQPGWGNNPIHLTSTTTAAVEQTRPPYAAGCGVNMFMNRGEAVSTQVGMAQQNSRPNEFPWMAFVIYHYGTYLTVRSAAIINQLWLLTVANDNVIRIEHLTGITVYFAHYRILGNNSDNEGQFFMKVPLTSYFPDPKNALAMLRLPTPVGFQNWNVQSICIPPTISTCASQCVPGARAIQMGWSTFFPDLDTLMQKASTEIPSGHRFLNTTFQLGAVVATVQFGRYSLCGFTGYDNTYLSLCDSLDWVAARQRDARTAPPPSLRRSNQPICGVNGYQITSAHVPHAMGTSLQSRPTGQVQSTLINEFPWQVGLNVFCNIHPEDSLCATCSGVIINNGWVLTTRTCFSGTVRNNDGPYRLIQDILRDTSRVVIRFGALNAPRISGRNRTQPVLSRGEWNMTVGREAVFYDPTRTFAMIKLPNTIPFNNWTVQPVCISRESDCADTCQPGSNVVLSGWKYEGGGMQKVTFRLPSQSGVLEPSWTPLFSFGSPIGVEKFTYGQTVPPSSPLTSTAYPTYAGQYNVFTLCGMVDGTTGRYVTTCGSYCWLKNPEAVNVPQYC